MKCCSFVLLTNFEMEEEMKRNKALSLALALFILCAFFTASPILRATAASSGAVDMHRLYNPNSGEHFYTSNVGEKDDLISFGWRYE